jgi:hypothetical protein
MRRADRLTDQQLALQAMSDAQHILEEVLQPDRTMISGSFGGEHRSCEFWTVRE